MNTLIKYATASALGLTFSACASTGLDKTLNKTDMTEAESKIENMAEKAVETMETSTMETSTMDTSMSLGDKMAEAAPKMDAPKVDMVEAEMEAETEAEAPMVGGAAMLSTNTIVENASNASNLTTLVAAVKQADLVETLSGDGPFTVFAPTNTAFDALPEGVARSLMADENKEQLVKVLTAHVVPGELNSDFLMAVVAGGRTYDVTTVSGDTLTFYKMGDGVRVADENGTLAKIETADIAQSNGLVHVVNSVLVPK